MDAPRASVFFGELLVDIVLAGDGRATYHAGGAPANAAVAATRAAPGETGRALLVAAVGSDPAGDWLMASLTAAGVDVTCVEVVAGHRTSLALTADVGATNERFWFYRDADILISPRLVAAVPELIGCLTYGSLSTCDPDSQLVDALESLKLRTRRARRPILLDLNYRASLWPSPLEFGHRMRPEVAGSTVVKANRREAALVVGGEDDDCGDLAHRLLALGPELVIVTDGPKGLVAVAEGVRVSKLSADPCGPASESIGTGDAITGHVARWLATCDVVDLSAPGLDAILSPAMGAARRVAAQTGSGWSLPHFPTESRVSE